MKRYEGLDVLRAGAMLLGVAYHATTSWLPDVGRWYFVADGSPVRALHAVNGFLHAWRMPLFFALGGFFAGLLYEKHGARGFLKERSRRLLLPLLLTLPVVLVLDVLLRRASSESGLMHEAYALRAGVALRPMHLWFLIYLWSYCALTAVLPPRFFRLAPVAGFPFVTAAILYMHRELRPDLYFWPQPLEFLHYGLFFYFGRALWRAPGAMNRAPTLFDDASPVDEHASVAGARFPGRALFVALALSAYIYTGNTQWQPHGAALSALVAWLITFGALHLGLNSTLRAGPRVRFVVAASYWVYLAHYPLVQAFQLLFARTSLPGTVEYGLTVAMTVVVLLGIYRLREAARRGHT